MLGTAPEPVDPHGIHGGCWGSWGGACHCCGGIDVLHSGRVKQAGVARACLGLAQKQLKRPWPPCTLPKHSHEAMQVTSSNMSSIYVRIGRCCSNKQRQAKLNGKGTCLHYFFDFVHLFDNVVSWLVARFAIVATIFQIILNPCIVWKVHYCGKKFWGGHFFLSKKMFV